MSVAYRLVIKGPKHLAERALEDKGFKSWRIVGGTSSETVVEVNTTAQLLAGDADDARVYLMSLLNSWFAEDNADGGIVKGRRNGSLLFWKTYEPRHDAIGYASKRTKILRDLDGVAADGDDYYTVVVPPEGRRHAPTTHGFFNSVEAAHAWADEHLEGQLYTVRLIQGVGSKWAPRTKIIKDLNGVDDIATHRDYQKPLWATVRSRRPK